MKILRLTLLLVFLFSACTSPKPLDQAKSTLIPNSSYPVPQDTSYQTSYPGQTSAEVMTESTPTRDPSKGAVRGRLLLKGKPVTKGIIYLSGVIHDSQGKEIVVTLDRESVLKSELDSNGNFSVVNLPPGRYGVILDMITQAYLLMGPNNNESLLVTVVAGKDENLGVLNYPVLPTGE